MFKKTFKTGNLGPEFVLLNKDNIKPFGLNFVYI